MNVLSWNASGSRHEARGAARYTQRTTWLPVGFEPRKPAMQFQGALMRLIFRFAASRARLALLLLTAGLPLAAHAQADAGLLIELRGGATYQAAGAAEAPAQTLMKLRAGDRVRLPAAAGVKVVYFKSAVTENWRGPASFVVGAERSEQGQGNVTSGALPGAAQTPVELTRLANINRIGGVVVRGIKPPEADIAQARERYQAWRAATGPDDLLPDFYLYSVLKQHDRKADMQALAADMLKRVPDSAEAQKLAQESAAAK
jgi:hypothetical protein